MNPWPRQYDVRKVHMGRASEGADLLNMLNEVCREREIRAGAVSLVGAVSCAVLMYYRQETKRYETLPEITQGMEIIAGTGNVSLKDGAPFVHLHLLLADEQGQTVAGHLAEGTIVFACEYTITELDGPALERAHDGDTGLYLWRG
ncbi:MAG: DNA-binding protein [Nitrospinae bacterium]|nr:DNA-binding protein [Nitrospinota bacterium]